MAIDLLYQADITGEDPMDALEGWERAGRTVPMFTREIVDGVATFQPEIDLLLEENATEWTVARMATVDRTIQHVASQ